MRTVKGIHEPIIPNHVASIRLIASINVDPSAFVARHAGFHGTPIPFSQSQIFKLTTLDGVEVGTSLHPNAYDIVAKAAVLYQDEIAVVQIDSTMEGRMSKILKSDSANLPVGPANESKCRRITRNRYGVLIG